MIKKTDDTADIAKANAGDPTPWVVIVIGLILVGAVVAGAIYLS